jgi:hypothetical protein
VSVINEENDVDLQIVRVIEPTGDNTNASSVIATDEEAVAAQSGRLRRRKSVSAENRVFTRSREVQLQMLKRNDKVAYVTRTPDMAIRAFAEYRNATTQNRPVTGIGRIVQAVTPQVFRELVDRETRESMDLSGIQMSSEIESAPQIDENIQSLPSISYMVREHNRANPDDLIQYEDF